MLTNLQNSFYDTLSSKFLTKPPHLKRVATLPCEMLMSKKLQQPETYNMINDTSQNAFSALTLLVGHQKEHPACKKFE